MKKAMSTAEKKQAAANEAAAYIKDGMKIGIGTGSTINMLSVALKKRIDEEGINVTCVAPSFDSKLFCEKIGLPLADITSVDKLDIVFDGADEVDDNLNGIKGGGASQTMEKILAGLAKKYVFVIDDSKKVKRIGEKTPVPIEVIPAAWRLVRNSLIEMGFSPEIRIAKDKDGPVVTDNGNYVIDIMISENDDVAKINREIKLLPGALETALFVDIASVACIGTDDGVNVIVRQ